MTKSQNPASQPGRPDGDTAAGSAAVTALQTLVIVPTYNEAENIELITKRLLDSVAGAHCLIVDDGSPDGTGAIAEQLAETDQRVHVLHRSGKSGLGAAYVAGFRWALDSGYDVVVEMDADGSHAPEELPRLLSALDEADLVLGSRWVPGGQVLNWPKLREAISRSGNLYTRLALGVTLHDITGGYRAYRSSVLRAIDLSAVSSQGYCFQVDLAWRALQAGFTVVEVPITFAEREHGQSKMSSDIVREAFVRVTEWGVAHRLAQARGLLTRSR